jgi:putative ABC transport system permease protein
VAYGVVAHLLIKYGRTSTQHKMLLNYLKITFRNLLRNRLFSTINILGLSISLASCLILFLYAQQELSYDQKSGDNVYRMISQLSQKDGDLMRIGSSSIPIGPRVSADLPDIVSSARLTGAAFFQSKDMIVYKDQSFFIENGFVADSTLFNILNFRIIAGNNLKPLTHTNAVVIDKEWAEKIFGSSQEAIGKMVSISTLLGPADYEVTAVIDNSQLLSHLKPSFVISTLNAPYVQFFNRFSSQWVGNNLVFTYLKLRPSANPKDVEAKINSIFLTNGKEEMESMGVSKEMFLQPIQEIHTSTGFMMDIQDKIDPVFIKVLITIGVLILILACFNYINLSTAQAGRRSLEVGIRKAMGVTSNGLMTQFLGESFIIVTISSILSILIAELVLPFFNMMVSTPISIGIENMGTILSFSLIFLVLTAIVAGFYPAVYLASFKPARVLKGRGAEQSSSRLRKLLVVLQFMISIVLISSIIIISQQVDYLQNKDLGFNSKSKLVLPLTTGEARSNYNVLKDKYSSLSQVREVTGSSSIPGTLILNDFLLYRDGQTMEDAIHIFNNTVDLNYAQLLDIELVAGNYFTKINTDTTINGVVLINELGVKELGWTPEEAIGQFMYFDWQGEIMRFKISGVVEDINQFSLHEDVSPLLFTQGREREFSYMVVDADLTNFQELIGTLETEWQGLVPSTPFEYYTLDDHLNVQYATDYNTFSLIKAFAIISLVISCLGLYALSMFVAERRFKEIGVRKALGASIKDVIILVTKDLSLLILIAFIVSIPLSIFGMNKWLETFAYRITPGIGTYLTAGIVSIIIGWITISYQSYRAAKTNPVNVLRDE